MFLRQLYFYFLCFCLQTLQSGVLDRVDQHQATYNPHHPAHQPTMFNSQEGQFDHLQREFLDSTQRESYSLDLVCGLIAQEYSAM